MLPSVHDHTLLGYRVSLEHGEVALRTIPDQRASSEPVSAREIIFEGCTAHFFEHPVEGSILGHIIELPLEAFVSAQAAQFEAGFSAGGWPAWWRGSVAEAIAFLRSGEQRAFEITSAYGFSGWVVARSCVRQHGSHAPRPNHALQRTEAGGGVCSVLEFVLASLCR